MTRRARSLAELAAIDARLTTDQGIERGLSLRLRPSDVVISPFAKCGTTWLQQIVHGLRTRGDMSFGEISEVIPWIELASDMGIDLEAPQVAEPRAFKSHVSWDRVPKGGRYIVSLRDPGDALVSMFRFLEGWHLERGAVPIEDFARDRFLNRDLPHHYWSHLRSWWPHRHDPDVLLLSYEGMQRDLPGAVRRIAELLGTELDEELFGIVVRQSSLEFMHAHRDQFDERLGRKHTERAAGLPPGSDSMKVREGRSGAGRAELPPSIIAKLQHRWREEIERSLGLGSYEELLDVLETEG